MNELCGSPKAPAEVKLEAAASLGGATTAFMDEVRLKSRNGSNNFIVLQTGTTTLFVD